MASHIIAVISAVLVLAATVQAKNDLEQVFTNSNGAFADKYYFSVNSEKDANILISPLGLDYLLTVTSYGTEKNTLKELRNALAQPENENEISTSYKAFTDSLKDDTNITFATGLYVDNKYKLKEQFKQEVTKYFDVNDQNLDLSGKPDDSTSIINKFVDNKTNHLIPEILEKGDIGESTAFVLVNAIHFKSQWEYSFYEEATKKEPFYGLTKEVKVDMMFTEDSFHYADSKVLNAELLELPYTGEYSFLIILPKDKKGINDVENTIKTQKEANKSKFLDIFKNLIKTQVEVHLPKFKYGQTLELVENLRKIGINDLFSSTNAAMGRMTENFKNGQLYVSKVIQKTFISVNENGTEAAAASAGKAIFLSRVVNYKVFTVDHPFIFVIKHLPSESPLFIGKVVDL